MQSACVRRAIESCRSQPYRRTTTGHLQAVFLGLDLAWACLPCLRNRSYPHTDHTSAGRLAQGTSSLSPASPPHRLAGSCHSPKTSDANIPLTADLPDPFRQPHQDGRSDASLAYWFAASSTTPTPRPFNVFAAEPPLRLPLQVGTLCRPKTGRNQGLVEISTMMDYPVGQEQAPVLERVAQTDLPV